jgi:hypothetical protein
MMLKKDFDTLAEALVAIAEYDEEYPDNPYMTVYKITHPSKWHVLIDRLDSAD